MSAPLPPAPLPVMRIQSKVLNFALRLLRPALLPALLIAATISAVFVLRGLSAQPRVNDPRLIELRAQRDRMQREVIQLSRLMLEFQGRTARAEQAQQQLLKQFEQSQREIVANQRALVQTQAALRRVEEALQLERSAGSERPNASDLVRSDSGSSDAGLEREIEGLRQECTNLELILRRDQAAFEQTWTYLHGLLEELQRARQAVRELQAARNGTEVGPPPAFNSPSKPLLDMPPRPGDLAGSSLHQRWLDWSNYYLQLQQIVDATARAISRANDSITQNQDLLRRAQAEILQLSVN